MDRDTRDVPASIPQSETESATTVELDQFSSVHRHLHERLCNELASLESRVRSLREAPSAHRPAIISTYERIIRNKRDFMERWGMDTRCGGHQYSVHK